MGKRTRAPAVRERSGSMIALGTDCTCVPLALRFLVHIHIIILLHVLVVVLFIYKYICRLEGYYFFFIYSVHRIVRGGTAEHS